MNNFIRVIIKFSLYASCAFLVLVLLREQPFADIKTTEFRVFSSVIFAFMILSGFFIPVIYSCIKNQYKTFYKSLILMSTSFIFCFILFSFLFFDSFNNDILIILAFGFLSILFSEFFYWMMFNKQLSKI